MEKIQVKLFDSELKIMEVLWKGGETTAKHIAEILKDQVREFETRELIDKMYDGSKDYLIAALLGNENLTPEEIRHMMQLIENLR